MTVFGSRQIKERTSVEQFFSAIADLWKDSGLARLLNFSGGGWKKLLMIAVACGLL